MTPHPDSRSRRRLIALIATGVILVVLAGFGIYGLLAGPDRDHTPTPPGETASPAPSAPRESWTPGRPQLPPVVQSRDAETFARNVAEALFAWDTGSGFTPLDYTSVILEVGDPSGQEQAGLAGDIAAYLPTQGAWLQLRQYATRQYLMIDSITIPEAWADAVARAQPGQLAPGTVAYTIEGTRHRDGMWNDDPQTSSIDVAFTVFIVCPPTGNDPCSLLRLSQLDNPLR
ncbi:hypothetical protein [Microbacterium panaciterrae]|uniref:hypothetical protein n=1 Tax=Microbacterium panaciterrae TaxID=985759 RepID=UPI0031ED9558